MNIMPVVSEETLEYKKRHILSSIFKTKIMKIENAVI